MLNSIDNVVNTISGILYKPYVVQLNKNIIELFFIY